MAKKLHNDRLDLLRRIIESEKSCCIHSDRDQPCYLCNLLDVDDTDLSAMASVLSTALCDRILSLEAELARLQADHAKITRHAILADEPTNEATNYVPDTDNKTTREIVRDTIRRMPRG